LQSHTNGGARFTGSASANGVHDHEDAAAAGRQNAVDIGGRARLFDAKFRQIFTHGDEKTFGIGHNLNVTDPGGA
jgi:hypothetical protein